MEGLNFSYTLAIITVIISYGAFQDQSLKHKFLFVPALIKERGNSELYRFITNGFIHADWMHLGFNMYVLYMFGPMIEGAYGAAFGEIAGRLLFLVMYFLGIIVSSIPSYIKHQDFYGYSALGASGAISAVVFSLIFFAPWGGIGIIFIPGFSLPSWIMGILYLAYSSYMSKRGTDNIGHDAHFAGAVWGFLFTLALGFLYNPDYVKFFWIQFTEGFGNYFG